MCIYLIFSFTNLVVSMKGTSACDKLALVLARYNPEVSIAVAMVWILCELAGMSGCEVDNGGCDQTCVTSYNGNYYCRCSTGYKLLADGKTCASKYSIISLFPYLFGTNLFFISDQRDCTVRSIRMQLYSLFNCCYMLLMDYNQYITRNIILYIFIIHKH